MCVLHDVDENFDKTETFSFCHKKHDQGYDQGSETMVDILTNIMLVLLSWPHSWSNSESTCLTCGRLEVKICKLVRMGKLATGSLCIYNWFYRLLRFKARSHCV